MSKGVGGCGVADAMLLFGSLVVRVYVVAGRKLKAV